jgi:hypothetical protein
MSHFSTIKTQITDERILIQSLQDLGFSVQTSAQVRGHNGLRLQADVVAVLPGHYDLGWTRNADGTYDLVADLWGVAKQHNQQQLLDAINQKYAVNKTISEIKRLGYNLAQHTVQADGTIKLIVQR